MPEVAAAAPPPNPVTRAELLAMARALHKEISLHLVNAKEPEFSIMKASFESSEDLIHEFVADELRDSAAKITKITQAIKVESDKLKKLKENLEALQNFAGQAAEVINAATQFLPYLA